MSNQKMRAMGAGASLLILVILVNCGGGDSGGGDTGTTSSAQAISTTLDEMSRVTATISTTGDSLTTTGPDGTIYTLTFAPNSTTTEIQVSLTPVISVSGMGLDQGFVAGLDMSPDGQQFLKPVTLTIELPSPLIGEGFPMGIHITIDETDFSLVPASENGNIYTIEIDHFSTVGLWEVTEESVTQFMMDKFYGPFGIEQTVRGITSCSDFRLDLLALKVLDFNISTDHVEGFIYTEEATIIPSRQCSGYWVGFEPRSCSSLFELADAARQNMGEVYRYFTNLATQQCSGGDASKEEEAFQCIQHALKWEVLVPDINPILCDIKTHCGIASLEIQPETLEINVGESHQVIAIAKDIQGSELSDREIIWEKGDADIATISNLLKKAPEVEGVSPGNTSITLHDVLGFKGVCPDPISYASGSVNVLNAFVTSADRVTVPEGDSNSFQVKLAYPPDVGVRATVSRVSGDGDITVASGDVLDFRTSDWDIFQTVLLYAYEDDDDVIDGSASIQIVDQRVSPTDPIVATKSVTVKEEDNDIPLMYISPDPLCVEAGKSANLSVLGNEFIDLNTIVWSSSDLNVASVDSTGVVTAESNGPTRIIADMIVDDEIVASAFSTIRVKDHCVVISRPESCIKVGRSSAFEPIDDNATLLAEVETAQAGHSLTWDSGTGVITVNPSGPFTSIVTSVSKGETTIGLTVDNVVTQYEAEPIPMTVATMPDDYQSSWLTVPGNGIAVLTDDREIISESQMSSIVLEAETRCNIYLPEVVAGNAYTDFNLSGQIIGYQTSSVGDGYTRGFVFNTETCTSISIDAPLLGPVEPPGGAASTMVLKQTLPYAINENGRIVGEVDWNVLNLDGNGDPIDGYKTHIGFIYDLSTGNYRFPMLPPQYDPYGDDGDMDPGGFIDINNNGIALGWFGTHIDIGGDFLFDTNIPGFNPWPIYADKANALNDYERVVGLNWIYSKGEVYLPQPLFSEGPAPQIYNFRNINNAEDVLVRSVPAPYVDKYFVMYICPFSVENDIAAHWFEDKTDLDGYEELEVSCDGLDNDLDGFTDVPLVAPLTDKQSGVCSGTVQKCKGKDGWINDYSNVSGYDFPETSCDDQDNDCDGIEDEGCD